MKQTVTLMGAAGKIGSRCTDNLLKQDYNLFFCEKGEIGLRKLQQKGLKVTPFEKAVPSSDFVIMAVPDTLLSDIAKQVVPLLKENATMIMLDPAVPYAGGIPLREGITYVVTHPCHPALFREQETPKKILKRQRNFVVRCLLLWTNVTE